MPLQSTVRNIESLSTEKLNLLNQQIFCFVEMNFKFKMRKVHEGGSVKI